MMMFQWPANWTSALAALLMLSATGAFAADAEIPPAPPKQAEQPARATHRICTDMNGQRFNWEHANVPFASSCHVEEDKPAAPAEPQQTPK